MKSSSSIPWIEQEFENSVFDFERLTSVSSEIPIAASCYVNSKILLNAYRNGVFPWSDPINRFFGGTRSSHDPSN